MKTILLILVISSVAILESSAILCTKTGMFCPSADTCKNPTMGQCSAADVTNNAEPTIKYICPTGTYCKVTTTNDVTFEGQCLPDLTCTTIFYCDDAGIYPNPSDCQSYYQCSAKAAAPVLKTCYSGGVFSPSAAGYCTPRIGNLNCFTLTCPTTGGGQLIKFGNTQRYYAQCSPGSPPLMRACPKGSNFKEATKKCEYVCLGLGNFPHLEDAQKYFTCTYTPGIGVRGTEESCAVKQIYNVLRRLCVKNLF
ncbi:unnamed protein product [Diamesa serratosioi]